jgi:glucan endo-1,3-alpha-glucosidase
MRKMWMDAIKVSHPDWVEIITWNDFVEGTYVSPIDDPNKYQCANFLFVPGVPLFTLGCFHSHYAATDLLPYFVKWYKTGQSQKLPVTRSTSHIERSRQATTQVYRGSRTSTVRSPT